jgi:hypothetical protein
MEQDHAAGNIDENQGENNNYVNQNPKATPDEVRLGTFLHQRALTGRLPEVKRVEGAPKYHSSAAVITVSYSMMVGFLTLTSINPNPRTRGALLRISCKRAARPLLL